MSKEIKKFISTYQDISEMKSQIWEIEKSVKTFEKNVIDRIIEIRRIRAKIHNNAVSGRVVDVCRVSKDDISFEVSYCGCCENDEEDLDIDLLLMKDEDVIIFFTTKKKERDADELIKKQNKKLKEKIQLEEHEKREYERLNKKYAKSK